MLDDTPETDQRVGRRRYMKPFVRIPRERPKSTSNSLPGLHFILARVKAYAKAA